MKIIILTTCFSLSASIGFTQKNKSVKIASKNTLLYSGFLKANGKIIVDGNGQKVILRGMGLGGWMLQEGYMFKLANFGRQYKIREAIQGLIGPQQTERFYQQWLTNHTRKIDIDSMAAWGFNSVRLPMHYNLYTLPVEEEPVPGKNTWLEPGFALTDSLLAWCKANRMYLILDLHATPGGQGHDLPISDRNPDRPSLWESEANRQKMIALWRKLAERYATEPWIGGYDIINEPNWGFEDSTDKMGEREMKNAPLKKLMMDVTQAIREVDKQHLIIIEGNRWGNSYNGLLPTWDNNMALSFHKYGTLNTPEGIRGALGLQEKWNVPLWLGEAGENSNTWFTEAIHLVETHDIGWSWWQEKKMGSNNPLEIRIPTGYQKLLDYWNGKGDKPATAEAQQVLDELLQNIKLENNIYHQDVTDAMFRQVYSTKTIPFKSHTINREITISAADYDLGRAGSAYSDRDTARYQYASPPSPSAGNRGREYRNDGVDIQSAKAPNGQPYYYVFSIEDGEWMQYAVTLAAKGTYTIRLVVADSTGAGRIALYDNGKLLVNNIVVPASGSATDWQVITLKDIPLPTGENKFRMMADKGGFTWKEIRFSRQSSNKDETK